MDYSWAISVILCFVAAIVSNFGLNLQKLAWLKHSNVAVSTTEATTSTPKLPRSGVLCWFSGLICIFLGSLFDFLALGFGAQSVVAPLGALTLVANVFIAPVLLGEEIFALDVIATLTILTGCVVAVAFASHKQEVYTAQQLLAMVQTQQSAIYFVVVLSILAVALAGIYLMEQIVKKYGMDSHQYKRIFAYHRFSYAAISGVTGAQSVLFAKIVIEIMLSSAIGTSSYLFLLEWRFYIALSLTFLCVALQIYWLNCGLRRWDALYNVPVFQCFWILVSVIAGGVVFNEFSTMNTVQSCLFPFGVFLCVVGVYVLSKRDVEHNRMKQENASLSDLEAGNELGIHESKEPCCVVLRHSVMPFYKITSGTLKLIFQEVPVGMELIAKTLPVSAVLDNIQYQMSSDTLTEDEEMYFSSLIKDVEGHMGSDIDEQSLEEWKTSTNRCTWRVRKGFKEESGKWKLDSEYMLAKVNKQNVLTDQYAHGDILFLLNKSSLPISLEFIKLDKQFRHRNSVERYGAQEEERLRITFNHDGSCATDSTSMELLKQRSISFPIDSAARTVQVLNLQPSFNLFHHDFSSFRDLFQGHEHDESLHQLEEDGSRVLGPVHKNLTRRPHGSQCSYCPRLDSISEEIEENSIAICQRKRYMTSGGPMEWRVVENLARLGQYGESMQYNTRTRAPELKTVDGCTSSSNGSSSRGVRETDPLLRYSSESFGGKTVLSSSLPVSVYIKPPSRTNGDDGTSTSPPRRSSATHARITAA